MERFTFAEKIHNTYTLDESLKRIPSLVRFFNLINSVDVPTEDEELENFCENFINVDPMKPEIPSLDEDDEEMGHEEAYNARAQGLLAMSSVLDRGKPFKLARDQENKWLYGYTLKAREAEEAGEEYLNGNRGRMYIRVLPEQFLEMPAIIKKLAEKASEKELPVKIKTWYTFGENMFQCRDTVVFYFDAADQQAVLEVLHTVFKQGKYSTSLDQKGAPLEFSLPVQGFPGVSFAQDNPGGKSFKVSRAKLLARVYREILKSSNLTETMWREICTETGIDAHDPAFNVSKDGSSGRELFPSFTIESKT